MFLDQRFVDSSMRIADHLMTDLADLMAKVINFKLVDSHVTFLMDWNVNAVGEIVHRHVVVHNKSNMKNYTLSLF